MNNLTEQQYDEIYDIINDKLNHEKYSDYFEKEWWDAIDYGANSAEVYPGDKGKLYGPPEDCYPPEPAELEDCDVDYYDIKQELFDKFIAELKNDQATPKLLKANIDDQAVQNMLEDYFIDYMVPFDEDLFYDKILNRALELNYRADDEFDLY